MFSANSSQVSSDALYVEDVFSTSLYLGTNANQTITNSVDLSGKGGMVLLQCRSNNTGTAWNVYDTQRGVGKYLESSGTSGQSTAGAGSGLTSFNSNGFTLGTSWNTENFTNYTYASWTFREAPKFFDVVTYTGNGSNRTIAHSLGAIPGCIIIKRLQDTYDWQVYHRSNANTQYMVLNSTAARATGTTRWNSTTPTSTEFSLGTDATVNASGGTYVAYLFAHDTTSDGIIQCGSLTSATSGTTVNLGWEPQWIMVKSASSADTGWMIYDTMRGWVNFGADEQNVGNDAKLTANSAAAEDEGGWIGYPTSTGFYIGNIGDGVEYIYIAIRRGPMRIPTSGSDVFNPRYYGTPTSQSADRSWPNELFKSDMIIADNSREGSVTAPMTMSRLAGRGTLQTFNTNAENPRTRGGWGGSAPFSGYTSASNAAYWNDQNYPNDPIVWHFKRAPSFFDVVCYTGNNVSGRTISHNLKAIPELMIVKRRSAASDWIVYSASISADRFLQLNLSDPSYFGGNSYWNNTRPTSSVFTLGNDGWVNGGGAEYVAYLFSSCPGVSKVGTYTGNGSSQTINCGFAAGARFVMIKRTDGTGDWYVWDTSRGIVAGNDPHLSLNTQASQVTTDDSIDTDSSGFVVNQLSATNINVSSATYIYLAIA